MNNEGKYIIITPVRNEEKYIKETINSVLNQTIPPMEWIIVNDGSSDNTGNIINEYSRRVKWIKAVHRKDRGFRKAGGGVIEAFYSGFGEVKRQDWDFIVKLDGDLSFDQNYFQKCIENFSKNPKLGIGGGTVCILENGKLKVDAAGDPPFHVRGATKIYRRECWEQISPLVKAPGWDTIDEVKANMYGWKTKTFSDLKIIQHKPTGGADGSWRNWVKNGRANYVTGYHPVFMLAKCIRRAFQRPLFIASVALFFGFWSGYLKRIAQVQDEKLIHYLRKEQIRRLLHKSSIYG
jgi:glycosyltransferase involved in cell wall biosynthesis